MKNSRFCFIFAHLICQFLIYTNIKFKLIKNIKCKNMKFKLLFLDCLWQEGKPTDCEITTITNLNA